jgi:hypothetical protein
MEIDSCLALQAVQRDIATPRTPPPHTNTQASRETNRLRDVDAQLEISQSLPGWMDGGMDGWMNDWMDAWMDGGKKG